MIKIGMLIGERYEILEKIGTGGMSDVYKAKCHKLNRFVAVKVLKQEFSENTNFVSKFRIEAQAAAGLMHPNIVNVYDVGEENGIYYIVMELVEGITLKKYIEKKARLSVKESVTIAIQVSMGIEAAHNNHIIHRDIKPQNIIISRDGKVKVTDFGIAKAATSNTITSNVMGSVHYTSPEQARGGYSDEKSDIYSLGITLFEMLTGRVPFNGETTVAIAIKHIQEEIPSPRDYVAEIPVSVEQIVFKCTQKSPDRRYQSVPELVDDLKKSLMNPDEDFVKVIDMNEGGQTRAITDQDYEKIKKQSAKRDTYEESVRKNAAPMKSASGTKNKPKKAARPIPEEMEEDDHTMERITTVLAIVAAILIGVTVLILVGNQFGLFDFLTKGGTIGESPVTPRQTQEAESAEDHKNANVTVPNVVGKSRAEAVSILEQEGFVVNKTEAHSETVEKDNVISMSPEADSKAARGSAVSITLSLGSDNSKITMPDLLGKNEMDATMLLVELGLKVGKVDYINYEDAAMTDLVVYQSESVGAFVEAGTAIDIKISTGPENVTYSFNASIDSPALEDPQYKAGTSTRVVIATTEGVVLTDTTTTSFPMAVNYNGITGSGTGLIAFTYTVTTDAGVTQDENGEMVSTPGSSEEKTVTRPVAFTPES